MRDDVLGLAKQVDLETPQTVMEYFPGITTASRGHTPSHIEEEETTGTRYPEGIELGSEFWAPTAAGPIRYGALPRILSSFFGAPVTTTPDGAGAPTARQHAFGAGVAPVPHSILMAAEDPNPAIVDLFEGALGNTLSLSADVGQFMRWNAAWVAKDLDDAQPSPVVVRDVTKRIAFTKAKAYLSVNGGAEAEVKVGGWSLEYSNGITPDDFVLGSTRLFDNEEGNAACTVRFSPRQTLSTHVRRALKADPDSVKVRLEALGPVIGAAVAYKIEVVVYACEYLSAPADLSAAEKLKMVNVEARAKLSGAEFVDVNVVNEVATY